MSAKDIIGLWCDDITFCQETCDRMDCPRNKENIRDRTIPHSYSVEIPEDCLKEKDRKYGMTWNKSKEILTDFVRKAVVMSYHPEDMNAHDVLNALDTLINVIDENTVCINCPYKPVKPTYQQGKIYCGACGKRIPSKINANYCHKCGRGIDWFEQDGTVSRGIHPLREKADERTQDAD